MKEGIFAVLDLGTNTFNLLIVEIKKNVKTVLVHERYSVKLGKDGIQNKLITAEASQRALDGLDFFKNILDKYPIPEDNIKATATSAFRNAKNGYELTQKILLKTGIKVEIIDGETEAELIYFGVKSGLEIGEDPVLIMDIGGGSVEFIICNQNYIYWKKSYEIGAQRLLDMFHNADPMAHEDLENMYAYLENTLSDLQNHITIFKPNTLIGSSGTFDTLCDIYINEFNVDYQLETGTEFELPLNYFGEVFYKIITKNIEQRKKIPGMSLMRVDMIVVSVCLIDIVLKNFYINKLRVSFYSLKEGMLHKMTNQIV